MDLILVDTPPYKMAEKEKDSERRENGGIREEKRSLSQRGEGEREGKYCERANGERAIEGEGRR